MRKIRRLPDAELEVMMVLWQAGGPVTSAYVCDHLKNGRDWKVTSVLTFLSRLAEKGFVSVERSGRSNNYTALVGESEYRESEGRRVLGKLFGNSLTAFVASLYDSRSIGDEELAELKRYLEENTKEGRP